MTNYINEAIYAAFTAAVCLYHAKRFNDQKTVNHAAYFALSCGFGLFLVWISRWNWWFAAALFCFRVWFYNPFLNRLRGRLFFYTHAKGPNSSWIDAHLGDKYPYFFWLALAGFIFIQFKL